MNRHLIATVCVAALALAACQKQQASEPVSDLSASSAADSNTVAASDAQGSGVSSNGVAATSPNLASADFVDMAAAGDMYEIQAAKIALKRSKNADVQALAKMMIKDHTQSSAMIKKAIADGGESIELPSTLPNDKQEMIGALNAASPETFDKTYLTQQASAHQDALMLMSNYASTGSDPHLKDAASKISPVVQMHIDHIKTLQGAMH